MGPPPGRGARGLGAHDRCIPAGRRRGRRQRRRSHAARPAGRPRARRRFRRLLRKHRRPVRPRHDGRRGDRRTRRQRPGRRRCVLDLPDHADQGAGRERQRHRLEHRGGHPLGGRPRRERDQYEHRSERAGRGRGVGHRLRPRQGCDRHRGGGQLRKRRRDLPRRLPLRRLRRGDGRLRPALPVVDPRHVGHAGRARLHDDDRARRRLRQPSAARPPRRRSSPAWPRSGTKPEPPRRPSSKPPSNGRPSRFPARSAADAWTRSSSSASSACKAGREANLGTLPGVWFVGSGSFQFSRSSPPPRRPLQARPRP